MKSPRTSKIATLMVHTSPLDQAGTGDAGGMNVYVVETTKKMAQAGVSVDIFTRANKPNLPESIEIADGVNVKHLVAGDGRLTTRMMQAVPGLFMKEGAEGVQVCALSDGRVIAIKIIDGSWRPVAPIIMEIFKRWGVEMPDESVKIYGGTSVIGEVIANI